MSVRPSLYPKLFCICLCHLNKNDLLLYLFLVLGLGQKGQSGHVGQAKPVRVARVVSWQYGLLWFDLV